MAHTRRMGLRSQAGPKRLPRHLRNEDLPTDTFTPRTYQVELLHSALRQNTIVCMSSGSGKTFIAVLLMKELALDVRKPLADGGKRSVYLVNSDAMVEQQAKAIQHPSDLTVGQYPARRGLSSMTADQWLDELESHNVLVMMSETFLELLQQTIFRLGQVNLLVLDDCQLALHDHPYQRIMEAYQSCPSPEKPRLLCLTNSVLNSRCRDPESLENMIKSLEETLCSVAETSMLVISERYGIKPDEKIIECADFDDSSELCQDIAYVLECAIDFLDECKIEITEELDNRDPKQIPTAALVECHNILYQLGPWCAACIADMLVGQIEKIEKQKEFIPLQKKFLKLGASTLRMVSKIFENNFKNAEYSVEELLSYSTPKVAKLIESFRKYRPETDFIIISEEVGNMPDSDAEMSDDNDSEFSANDDDDDKLQGMKQVHVAVKKLPATDESKLDPLAFDEEKYLCGIVFVEHQHTAFALSKFIEEVCAWDENLCFVKNSHITGHTVKTGGSKETRIYRKQEEVLRKFRMQELNLLVSTSVLEEGVDVPKCNLVVRFDVLKDYRSYSHTKGRARARGAEFIILIEEENFDEFDMQLQKYKGIERVLIGHRKTKQKEELAETNGFGDDQLPPYLPSEEEQVQVSLSNSISLVNRYCAKLPSDAFTHLTPTCQVIEINECDNLKYVATLRLPINSPIKEEIKGVPMPTKLLAKKAVALKMCEILHKRGELDEHLMPVGKEMFQQVEEEGEVEEEDTTGEARPGTTKRKQYYNKKVANALVQSHPGPNMPNNLYIVNMKLTGPITDEQNTRGRRINAPEDSTRCFGILTSNSIPQVPFFPVYTRSGEVTVSLDILQRNVYFTNTELVRLELFHRFLFANVLRLEKDPMGFSPEEAAVGYLLLPLNEQDDNELNIDWHFCDKVDHSLSRKKPGTAERSGDVFEFDKDSYEDAVVMPSYRNIDQPQHFYVAEIRYDLNPLSSFPSPELYKTFCAYYSTKYGLTISNMEQPLLDVDHTSARLNLLIPRYMNQKGVALPTSSAETKKARRENLQQKQILVPELCDVHVFPGSLWRKAVCLPAILYRMNYLLLAEEIRTNVSLETKIGVANLPQGFRFPQLDFGFDTNPEKLKISNNNSEKEKKNGEDKATNDEEVNDQNASENLLAAEAQNKTAQENPNIKTDKTCDEDLTNIQPLSPSIPDTVVPDKQTSKKASVESGHHNSTVEESQPNKLGTCLDKDSSTCKADSENSSHVQCNGLDTSKAETDATISKLKPSQPLKSNKFQPSEDGSINCQQSNKIVTDLNVDLSENCMDILNGLSGQYCKFCKLDTDLCKKISSRNGCSDVICSGTKPSRKTAIQTELPPEKKRSVQVEVEDLGDDGSDDGIPDVEDGVSRMTVSKHKLKKHLEPSLDEEKSGWGDENGEPNKTSESMGTWGEPDLDTMDTSSSREPSDETVGAESKSYDEINVETNDVFADVNHFTMEPEAVVEKEVEQEVEKEVEKEEDISTMVQISLDEDIDLNIYQGPSPCTILQGLTMSNANDFFSLERLETIGDSFLKYAITVYLYCSYPGIHEGKLSYLRSKQVSNYNLYRLGKKKGLGECMISTKFEPYENWLPPCFVINEEKKKGPVPKVVIVPPLNNSSSTIFSGVMHRNSSSADSLDKMLEKKQSDNNFDKEFYKFTKELEEVVKIVKAAEGESGEDTDLSITPYSLQVHHSIPDKSIADGIEALIGCYLTSCGKMAALRFMSWLGLKVLPKKETWDKSETKNDPSVVQTRDEYEHLPCPQSPLLTQFEDAEDVLNCLLNSYEKLEATIGYTFRDRSYLLQAFTHASYHYNTVTDCYQRLEFLGDAILDYVITRHLYEDSCKYSPGVLTDLRSSLVNNNIFAALAVKWDFHKYFKAISPALFRVIEKFVARQKEREDEIDLDDDESEDEDQSKEHVELEVPKALGDIFESVAGAIYLDSGMSLDVVWGVYYRIMRPQIHKYLKSIPKSPVRELLEMEPETAKFEKPERMLDGKIRVVVNVVGKGAFTGVGRNYRIAKSAAAKKALRSIKMLQLQGLI